LERRIQAPKKAQTATTNPTKAAFPHETSRIDQTNPRRNNKIPKHNKSKATSPQQISKTNPKRNKSNKADRRIRENKHSKAA